MEVEASSRQLRSSRLTLRPHVAEDFESVCTLWSDPATTAFIGGRPSTREECWARLLRYIGLWSALGYGYWAVFESATGRFGGEVGLADFRRGIDPPLDAPEAGWAIVPAAQGRGYASEALSAALGWADAALEGARTSCIISPDNKASARVAAKVGYRHSRSAQYGGGPIGVFERPPQGI